MTQQPAKSIDNAGIQSHEPRRKKRKGIAATWLETYKDDVYPHDYVIMNGQKLKPPRYYDNQLAASDQIGAILMKLEREFSARSQEADNTPKRLAAKEKVAQANST